MISYAQHGRTQTTVAYVIHLSVESMEGAVGAAVVRAVDVRW